MKPYDHAVSSAKQFGGIADDYLQIHNFMDSSKAHIADGRHRAILHSSFGIFITEKVFGVVIENSEGKNISVRDIAEQHVLEDLGTIPTVADWLKDLPIKSWMGNKDPKSLETSPTAILSNLNKQMKEQQKELMEPFIQEFQDKLLEFIKENNIPAIMWTQYTPGFNDGAPCEFTISGPEYYVEGNSESDYDDGSFEYGDKEYIEMKYTDIRRKIKLSNELSDIFDLKEVFEAAFGPSSKIFMTIDSKKFIIDDEYNCGY